MHQGSACGSRPSCFGHMASADARRTSGRLRRRLNVNRELSRAEPVARTRRQPGLQSADNLSDNMTSGGSRRRSDADGGKRTMADGTVGIVDAPSGESANGAPSAAMRMVDGFAEGLVVIALVGELALVLANVVARVFFHTSFLWTDEVARLALSVLAFVGGAVAYRRRDHAFVRVLLDVAPAPAERTCVALADIIVLFVVGLTGIASAEFIASSWGERTPILQLPAALIALP